MKASYFGSAELKAQLARVIKEPVCVVSIDQFEEAYDDHGKWISDRDAYRKVWEARLNKLREICPDRHDLQNDIERVLLRLEEVPPHERLFYWEAESSSNEYSGVSCVSTLISWSGNAAERGKAAQPGATDNPGNAQ